MKILSVALLIVFLSLQLAYADLNIIGKTGYSIMKSDDASGGVVEEVAVEYKHNKFAGELSFGHWQSNCKGNEADALDYKYVGILHAMPLLLITKYYPVDWFSIGIGGGNVFYSFRENYPGQADTKTSKVFCASVGFYYKSISIELRRIFGDLKIESGHPKIGILEDGSRIDSTQLLFKFKF